MAKIRARHDCGANGTDGCPMCTIEHQAEEIIRLKTSLRNQAHRNHDLKKEGVRNLRRNKKVWKYAEP